MNKTYAAVLLCGALVGCTGTDTGNPPNAGLAHFDTSGCKSSLNGDKSRWGKVLSATVHSELASDPLSSTPQHEPGLGCVSWQRIDDETLQIEIKNHSDGCSADLSWVPRAELKDAHTLNLFLDNPRCTFAGCLGNCIYDLTFEVKVDASLGDLEVHLLGDDCNGERSDEATPLPTGSQRSGALCKSYANYDALRAIACNHGVVGEAFYPCEAKAVSCSSFGDSVVDGGADDEPVSCQSGLVCRELGERKEKRCLPSCGDDTDCAPYPSTRCVDDVCQL